MAKNHMLMPKSKAPRTPTYSHSSVNNIISGRILYRSALLLASAILFAPLCFSNEDAHNTFSHNPAFAEGKVLRIDAKQIQLGQILKTLENQSGVQLHYSGISQKIISADCVGNMVEVLKCLLGHDANLMYRYPDEASKSQPAEIWILDASAQDATRQTTELSNCIDNDREKTSIGPSSLDQASSNDDEAKKLLALSQSQSTMQRKEAITRLAIEGEIGDQKITEALETALTDPDSSVRAQAINGLARRNEPGVESVLREALHDPDAQIRLMAVDSAGQNISLLEQALDDPNATVRALASMKLKSIEKLDLEQ